MISLDPHGGRKWPLFARLLGLPPAGEEALRVLLAERFNLKVRVETRRQPIYELVVHRADGKLGPNLLPAKGGCRAFLQREPVNVGL